MAGPNSKHLRFDRAVEAGKATGLTAPDVYQEYKAFLIRRRELIRMIDSLCDTLSALIQERELKPKSHPVEAVFALMKVCTRQEIATIGGLLDRGAIAIPLNCDAERFVLILGQAANRLRAEWDEEVQPENSSSD